MIKIGDTINDLFYVTGKIYKDVFVAENKITQEKYYISKIKSEGSKNTLHIFKNIRHPLLPEIYEIFNFEGYDYYRTAFIQGETLFRIMNSSDIKLSCEMLCRYVAQISKIIQLLHSQFKIPVLHLEISTETIIISDKNTVHLLNYGFSGCSSVDKSEELTDIPVILNDEKHTIKSDIYLIGETLQSILKKECSKISFNTKTGEYMRGIPVNIEKIISRSVIKNPDFRYNNAKELESDLLNVCDTFLKNGVFPDVSYVNEEKNGNSYANKSMNTNEVVSDYGELSDSKQKYESINQNSNIVETLDKLGNANSNENINDNGPDIENVNINRCTESKLKDKFNSGIQNTNKYNSECARKSKIICVWDNAVFASEIACVIADKGNKVLLIDADLLSPKIDLLIELKHIKKNQDRIESFSCLSGLMEEFSGQKLTPEFVRDHSLKTARDNLNTICGDYKTEDYEYYSTQGYADIITKGSEIFDYIVISCSKFIYDEFTCVSLIKADMIFIPIIASNIFFREFNKYIHFMIGRKQLVNKNVRFAGFDYSSNEDFSLGICDEMCEGKFAGVVSYSSKRRITLGSGKFYTSIIENKIERQYLNILKNSGIKI